MKYIKAITEAFGKTHGLLLFNRVKKSAQKLAFDGTDSEKAAYEKGIKDILAIIKEEVDQ